MKEGYVLVDYHNLHDAWLTNFMGKNTPSTLSFSKERHQASIQHVIDQILSRVPEALYAENCLPSRLIIRLYGGWFFNRNPTDDASMVKSAIKNAPARLKAYKHSRINIDIARALIEFPTEPIDNTLQIRTNLPRIKFSIPPKDCVNSSACALASLQRDWREFPCVISSCPVKLKNAAAASREQKCVDVHLACDLISLSGQQPVDSTICLVTNDYDLYPAVRACTSRQHPKLLWAFSHPYERKLFLESLARSGVKILSVV